MALIKYEEIIFYNKKDYTLKITEERFNYLSDLDNISISGTPFAITIDKEVIYTGYFWSSLSSASCQCIVIDHTGLSITNKLYIQLGYPGIFENEIILDERNNERLLEIFKTDNKLKSR